MISNCARMKLARAQANMSGVQRETRSPVDGSVTIGSFDLYKRHSPYIFKRAEPEWQGVVCEISPRGSHDARLGSIRRGLTTAGDILARRRSRKPEESCQP